METFWVEAGEGTRGGVEERNPNAVLTRFLVQEIRERYAAEAVSQAALAADYGVNQGTISAVVRGETWENIDGPRQAPLSLSDRAKRKALL
ncbi:MAG TPA: hypothetical protein VMZ73_09020 [Acidimicrobiales bacterium]|nr:hypothetical protein [Acidimicrobiales bacterium]